MINILALLFLLILTAPSYATLTVGNVPVTKTGGSSPAVQDSIITATSSNVGIGSTAPSRVLDVVGTGRFSSTLTASNLSGTNTGDQTNITGNAGTVTTNADLTGPITSSGNATSIAAQTGTGTTFVVQNTPTLTTPVIGVATGTSLTTTGNIGIGTTTISDGGLIVMNQNVGVGTLHPGTTLDVQGTTRQTGFVLGGNGAAAGFILQSSGTVGVGTWVPSPTGGGSTSPGGNLGAVQYNSPVGTFAGDETKVSINPNGNVGIGTTNGRSLLEVTTGNVGIGTFLNRSVLGVNGGVTIGAAYGDKTSVTGNLAVLNNIGIGTWAPTKALQVGTGANLVSIDNAGTMCFGSACGFTLDAASGGITSIGGVAFTSLVSNGLALSSSGTVSIQNSSASAVSLLRLIGGVGTGSALELRATAGSGSGAERITFATGNNGSVEVARVSGANIGIGTTGPAQTLSIVGNVGIGTTKDGNAWMINTPPAGSIAVEKNVGIGTFNPTGSFQLFGNGAAAGNVLVGNAVGVGTWMAASTLPVSGSGSGTVSSGTVNQVTKYAATGTTVSGSSILFDDATNVGVGTSVPQAKFQVNNRALAFTVDSNSNVGIGTVLTGTAGLSVMTGNVGVGTWLPNYALEVEGGNVGIGTWNMGGKLNVNGDLLVQASNGRIWGVTGLKTGMTVSFQFGGDSNNALDTTFGLGPSINAYHGLFVRSNTGGGVNGPALTAITGQADKAAMVARGASAQTANLQEWQNSSSVIQALVTSTGGMSVGTSASGSKLTVLGNVGIGTVATSVYTTTAAPAGSIIIERNIGIGTINPSNSLIVATGNVGIGSLFPGSLLDVFGSARVLNSGTVTLGENATIALPAFGTLSADGKYSGITEVVTAGETVAFGNVVYLKAADSQWYLTDADADSTAGAVRVGIAVTTGADNGSMTILTYGKIRADSLFPALTVGAPVYIGTTAGEVQTAQPSGTDDVIRILGYGNTGDEMFFNPDNTYLTHT